MKSKRINYTFRDIYLLPIGDCHIGDKAFNKESEIKLKGYIKWVKETKNARVFLMGDILNCATRVSKTSPFEQNMTLKEQIDYATRLFNPIKDKILGAIDGNHELRLSDYSGYSPTITLCERLNIPYFGDSAVLLFGLGCRKKSVKSPRATFCGYFHHTTGGGSTIGSKINAPDKLRNIVCNGDFYCGSHNHMLGCVHSMVYKINESSGSIEELRQMIVDCGGYLNYSDSYAEAKMLQPLRIGSPRIHLFIKNIKKRDKGKMILDCIKKDIHVSV